MKDTKEKHTTGRVFNNSEKPQTTETDNERIQKEIEEYLQRVPQVPENLGVL